MIAVALLLQICGAFQSDSSDEGRLRVDAVCSEAAAADWYLGVPPDQRPDVDQLLAKVKARWLDQDEERGLSLDADLKGHLQRMLAAPVDPQVCSAALTWSRFPGVEGVWTAVNSAPASFSGQLLRVPQGAGKHLRSPREPKPYQLRLIY